MIVRGNRRLRLNSNNGQNPGNADKMGISGVVLCRLALFDLLVYLKIAYCMHYNNFKYRSVDITFYHSLNKIFLSGAGRK